MEIKENKESAKVIFTKEIRKNDNYKKVIVEEVENGFIITIEKNYKEKIESEDGCCKDEYKYECKKYINPDNPFASKQGKENEFEDLDFSKYV